MKKVEALGAAGEVTGSAFVGTSNKGTKFLIDCGMFQGSNSKNDKRNKSLNSHDSSELDFTVITHSHLDHIGRLPHLRGDSPIFMTIPAKALAYIALNNSEQLSPTLYPKGSVNAVFKRITCVPYDSPVRYDGLTVTLRDAGHILGSASVEVQEENGEKIVFSGDLGNTPSRTVRQTTPIKDADIVVMETTYGDRLHLEEDPEEVILEAVERIKKNKGTLLIPAFAIDRTQAILSVLKKLKKEKKLNKIPVFLDAPMAIDVTSVYKNHKHLLTDELREEKDPFGFPDLVKTYTKRDSLKIFRKKNPKIVIAGSGMLSGGRVLAHAAECLSSDRSVMLFVGYPAERTLSREIAEGAKEINLERYGRIAVDAKIMKISSLSAHADQKQLLNWLKSISYGDRRLRQVILVHGEDHAREEFANKVRNEIGIDNISLPKENEIINFYTSSKTE
jgi:metallo-beta-lactamase family protein